jgi:hypothetical protein
MITHYSRLIVAPRLLLIPLLTSSLNLAWAVQSIDYVQANPSDIVINTPTTITVTSQIGLDATLIKSSVNLLEYDTAGQLLAIVPMYDDGTHGDAVPGDNIFTNQLVFNQPTPTTFSIKVSVAYKGLLHRIQSPSITINVVQVPSSTQLNNMLSLNQTVSTEAATLIQQYGAASARPLIIRYLKSQPGIANAGTSPDGETIWYQYTNEVTGLNGLTAYIFTNPPNTLGSSHHHPQTTSSISPSSNQGLIFSPISTYSTVNDELVAVYNQFVSPGCCIAPDPIVKDAAVTVDFMKTIYPYGVISIVTHGGLDLFGNVIFQTGEQAFLGLALSHLIDYVLGRLTISDDNYWLIEPSFITHYGGTFPGSLILFSTCHSLDNSTLSNALISKGAQTVFGWQNSVSVAFAGTTKEALLTQMIDNKKNTGDAYAAVPHVDTSLQPNAIFKMAGATNLVIPLNLVANGSFETADFGGWVVGADYAPVGYAAVVTGNATDGTYSARLGRFDEVYAGGINGPPVPGEEPAGTDFIYQDVQLPSQLPASGHFLLTFSYNIQSYDSINYDWFDMLVEDPTSGAVLLSVVHDGNPSPDWGPYWNGGWQNVSVDLSAFAGSTVRLWFGDRQDGYGDQTATWIDNVKLNCH